MKVNGAETPELIPDDVAYAQFISALSIKADAPPNEVRRRKIMLASAGLPERDHDVVIAALRGVREELLDIAAERKARLQPPINQTVQGAAIAQTLRLRERSLIDTARTRLTGTLSVEGFQAFDRYIQTHVKRKIVLYGD